MLKTQDLLNLNKLIGGDSEVIFAVILQNALHPKNNNRTEAIKSGTYQSITTKDDAHSFINSLISSNFKNELMGIESECKNKLASL